MAVLGMPPVLHIVEPTLEGQAGHCMSFVESLCRAGSGRGVAIRVWAGRKAPPGGLGPDVEVRPHFDRRLRRLEALFLYRRLLSSPGRVFVSTAGRADLVLLSAAARGPIPPNKVYLYFHWVRQSPGKMEAFRRAARKQPDLVLMGPTATVVETFRTAGFRDVRLVPYPVTPAGDKVAGPASGKEEPFSHLLFAGAARRDKGFPRVVDLVEYLGSRGAGIPVVVQASADHYDKIDPQTREDLARLARIGYRSLEIHPRTLDRETYVGLFKGAVCLQPYDRGDFADRVSGVTLDAFSAGAPVVATEGTWMAAAVKRFDAGAAVGDLSAKSLWRVVEEVVGDYRRRSRNARLAGRVLLAEHDARRLFDELAGPGEARDRR